MGLQVVESGAIGMSEIGVGAVLLLSFILFAGTGYRKGAVKKIFSLFSLFVSLILAKLLYPFALRAVAENGFLRGIFTKIWSMILPVKNSMVLIPKGIHDFLPEKAASVNAPLYAGLYETMGKWQDYLAQQILTFLNGILFFILLYFLFRLLLKVVHQILEYLFRLPILNFGNRMLGMGLGAVEWVFFVWLILILFSLLPETKFSLWVLDGFSREGSIPYLLKENNWIAQLFLG